MCHTCGGGDAGVLDLDCRLVFQEEQVLVLDRTSQKFEAHFLNLKSGVFILPARSCLAQTCFRNAFHQQEHVDPDTRGPELTDLSRLT